MWHHVTARAQTSPRLRGSTWRNLLSSDVNWCCFNNRTFSLLHLLHSFFYLFSFVSYLIISAAVIVIMITIITLFFGSYSDCYFLFYSLISLSMFSLQIFRYISSPWCFVCFCAMFFFSFHLQREFFPPVLHESDFSLFSCLILQKS